MSSLCLSFCRLPSHSPLHTRTCKHTHSLTPTHTHTHTHSHTHKLPRLTYLWMEPERVSHMWFRLATLSPHRGPKLTTSTLPWSSTCVYVPFSVCHCVSACKSASLYLCLVCLFLCVCVCLRACVRACVRVCVRAWMQVPAWGRVQWEQWIKVSGPKRAKKDWRSTKGTLI